MCDLSITKTLLQNQSSPDMFGEEGDVGRQVEQQLDQAVELVTGPTDAAIADLVSFCL